MIYYRYCILEEKVAHIQGGCGDGNYILFTTSTLEIVTENNLNMWLLSYAYVYYLCIYLWQGLRQEFESGAQNMEQKSRTTNS